MKGWSYKSKLRTAAVCRSCCCVSSLFFLVCFPNSIGTPLSDMLCTLSLRLTDVQGCSSPFLFVSPPLLLLLLLPPAGIGQDLPHASGEGGAGERVKSTLAFSAKPEQQKDYMSELAVAESVAALGECVVVS